jgi:hypothetical protein
MKKKSKKGGFMGHINGHRKSKKSGKRAKK